MKTFRAGGLLSGVGFAVVLVASLAVSFEVTRGLRSRARGGSEGVRTADSAAFSQPVASGRYLVAFVLVSGSCGSCRHPDTRQAIRGLRDSLRAEHSAEYADISVIGVTIDPDVRAGYRYLQELEGSGRRFDQVSIGGGWMNEFFSRIAWREGLTSGVVPQVVVVERRVDAHNYPRFISVARDSMLLRLSGRDSLAMWVRSGTPLDLRRIFRTSAAPSPS